MGEHQHHDPDTPAAEPHGHAHEGHGHEGHSHEGHSHDDVDCEAALAEIYTYLDGELTDEKRLRIAHHLEGCNPCIEAFDFEAELRMVVSRRCRNDDVPETLRIRIAEKLTLIARGEDPDGDDEGARAAGA